MRCLLATGILSVAISTGFAAHPAAVAAPLPPATTRPATPPASTLQARLPNVTLDNVALEQALEGLAAAADLNIHVNWSALQAAGVQPTTPITLKVTNLPLRKVLQLLLAALDGAEPITWYVDGGVLEITSQSVADQRLITRVYPVQDLLLEIPDFIDGPQFDLQGTGSRAGGQGGSGGGLFSNQNQSRDRLTSTSDDRAQQLIDLITQLIRPEIWRDNGGSASIRHFRGLLIITAPPSVHAALSGSSR